MLAVQRVVDGLGARGHVIADHREPRLGPDRRERGAALEPRQVEQAIAVAPQEELQARVDVAGEPGALGGELAEERAAPRARSRLILDDREDLGPLVRPRPIQIVERQVQRALELLPGR
jgi:hypothetical protein